MDFTATFFRKFQYLLNIYRHKDGRYEGCYADGYGKNGKTNRTELVVSAPKIQSAVRTIPFSNFIIDMLKVFKLSNTNVLSLRYIFIFNYDISASSR